ncbi:hypothetical protein B0H14DRAFT_2565721 [Mycena olivaceomarginata]|nr:hypothetical protein B0H14DRAFT_2565721 [Mycena olivaceomarginata]
MYACILYVILFFPSFLLSLSHGGKSLWDYFWHRNKTQETAGMQAICMGHEKEEILMQALADEEEDARTLGQGLTLNQGLGDPDPSTQGHMGGHWLYVLSVKLSIQVGPGLEIYAGLMFTTLNEWDRVERTRSMNIPSDCLSMRGGEQRLARGYAEFRGADSDVVKWRICKAGVCRVSVPNVNGRTVEAKQRRWLRREKRGYEYCWERCLHRRPSLRRRFIGDAPIQSKQQNQHPRNGDSGGWSQGGAPRDSGWRRGDGDYTEKEGPLP